MSIMERTAARRAAVDNPRSTSAKAGTIPDMDWQTILLRRDAVATVHDLLANGLSKSQLRHHLESGRWQRPIRAVIVGHSGPLTERQRRLVGLSYGGRGALLSHRSAAAVLGLRITERDVEITVPAGRYRPSSHFVRVHQSSRPTSRVIRNGLPCSGAARTVVDVACDLRSLDDVRALVADAVQRNFTSVAVLLREAEAGPRHSPRHLRTALGEVEAGTRSAGEARFLALIRKAGLPAPELNVTVITAGGRFRVDALWRELGVAVEIDGAAWHLGSKPWESDLYRQNQLHTAGLVVLRFPVRRLRDDRDGVIREICAALALRAAH
jgi:very-short-patch-repair endonuclease